MHPKLAARIDQSIHREQLQHLRPGYALPALRQLPFPELVELQLPPQLASQPAVAERTGAPQLHLAELHLDAVDSIEGNRPIFRKQAQRTVPLPLLIKHRERLTPGRLLAVVDLPEVQHLPLRHLAGGQSPAFDHIEVAVPFAVLDARIATQEHCSTAECQTPARLRRGSLVSYKM